MGSPGLQLETGLALADLMAVVATTLILAGASVPASLGYMDRQRVVSAARYIAGAVAEARVAALSSGEATGLSVESEQGEGPSLQLIEDGDGDGVTAEDRRSGVDRTSRLWGGLADYRGVRLCIRRSGPSPEPAEQLIAGSPPIRLGADALLRFGPSGLGSSGSVYFCTQSGAQAAIRIFGPTGRVRVFVQSANGSWQVT
jgi:hypothetical protein